MPLASLNVGLVGIRTEVIDSLIPALQAQKRFTIASIYDSCYQAARELSSPLKAKPAASLTQMLAKNDLRGVIVLNTDWQRTQPIFMSCLQQIPTLFVPQIGLTDPFVGEQLVKLANDQRTLLMPAYSHRWSPALLRIQELTTTCLGPVESIELQTPACEADTLISSIDWCRNLIQSVPVHVTSKDTSHIELSFLRKQSDNQPVTARILTTSQTQSDSDKTPITCAKLTCRKGSITFLDDQHLTWCNGTEEHDEELSSDRSSLSVMLDLFGRRLSGGLVPVPILEDVIRNQQVLNAVLKCRESGRTESL